MATTNASTELRPTMLVTASLVSWRAQPRAKRMPRIEAASAAIVAEVVVE